MREQGILPALMLLLGCGGAALPGALEDTSATIPLDPDLDEAAGGGTGSCGGQVTIWLEATGLEPNRTVSLAISRVALEASGEPVASSFSARGTASFPTTGAYRLAALQAPGSETVDATIQFAGGADCHAAGCAAIEARGASLHFRFDPGAVRTDTCQVLVHLDFGPALQAEEGSTVFVPQFAVRY